VSWLYLAAILVSGLCMALVDRRWRLFAFSRPRLALPVVLIGLVFFLLWDVVAIAHGFYERGGSKAMTGIEVSDDLPLEEIFFVAFFCYVTMVVHGLITRVLAEVRR
jgi:lycopene cyclase domain-containing protein